MKQFSPRSGLRGFTREDGSWQCTGAAMGRRSDPSDPTLTTSLRVRKILLTEGYDDGGAYWGTPCDLWQVRGDGVESYTRAPDKGAALIHFRNQYPNCKIR